MGQSGASELPDIRALLAWRYQLLWRRDMDLASSLDRRSPIVL